MLIFSCVFLAAGINAKILTRIQQNSLQHQFEAADTEEFFAALSESGQIQFTGLGNEYKVALQNIRKNLPNCLEESLEVELDDGARRFTIARDTDTDIRPFPSCVEEDIEIITKYFDKVDKFVMGVLKQKFNSSLDISVQNQSYELEDLPTKSHLHLYAKDTSGAATEQSNSSLSLPFHTDHGLYLLLTPSPLLQLLTINREGAVAQIPGYDDSIILLLGTGLTSWLLPHHHLYSPPHAVPSITTHLTRTVFGRMKVAPLDATNNNSGITFGQHFYSGLAEDGDELHHASHGDTLHHNRLRRQAEAGHAHHWVGNKTITE